MQFHLLSHLTDFRGLSWRSGLFPFRLRSLSPAVWLLWYGIRYSEFDWRQYPGKGPHPISALPPYANYIRLALKLFRREPAITKFGKPFTPTHSSSKQFSTYNSSALHFLLQKVQPGHG